MFLGKVAPIDIGDVGGMNLWEIHGGKWNEQLLKLAGGKDDTSGLKARLGDVPEDGGIRLGSISKYYVERYGFSSDCSVMPSTGDNPSTILALPLRESDAMVSLGTSTTFLMSTPHYKPDPAYHFMNHPAAPGLYMFMLCYKNGGLAREQIRDELNKSTDAKPGSWAKFDETALHSAPVSQTSDKDLMRLGLFFPRPEIVPNLHAGQWRFTYDAANDKLQEQSSDPLPDDARTIIESQMLSLRLRSHNLVSSPGGSLPPQPRRVYLVGGGSANKAIAKIAGEVLGGSEGVFKLDIGGNACALGSAYKAVWACERKKGEGFEDLISSRWDEAKFVERIAEGYQEGVYEKYGEAVKGFGEMEKLVLKTEGEKKGQLGGGTVIGSDQGGGAKGNAS